ncbi:unnamed protein product [Mytilus coruscus]|uniref:Uncharacterized protein n=1 Tax=Mytilus coruscus TaxID=42192 RepID=A0A6J8EY94_MYTCO|nr:unnamed protein product [Mytilus coruscus]
MNDLTELRPSDLLVHSSFIDSQFDPFDDLLSSQRQTNIIIDVPSNTSNISNDTSITESIIRFIQEDLLSLPKDSFVSKLIDKCQNAHCDIDDIRYALLEIAKCQHNFPYLNATLKKRLCPRKPNGESVENKLGSYCYALYLASLGEYTEDLRLTLNTRSHTQSARKMSTADENNQTQSNEISQNLYILKSKSEQVIASAETFDNSNVTESDLSQSTEPIQRNSINEHSHFQLSNTLVDSQTKHVRSSDVTNLSVLVKDIPVQSNIVNPAPSTSIEKKIMNTNNNITGNEQNTNIQVHFQTSMCNPTTVDNFRGFVKKTRQRVSRFYVGGIDKHNSCEESMREYLAARGVNVTHLRYFDKQNRRTASAQLYIDAQCETLIRDPFFWPEGIFFRKNGFHGQFFYLQRPNIHKWL